jgi:hypothetical protein
VLKPVSVALFMVALLLGCNTQLGTGPNKYADCSKGDLPTQFSCLTCRAIYNHDDKSLQAFLSPEYSGLVQVNDPNACIDDSWSGFLHASFLYNNMNAFQMLLAAGADVNALVHGPGTSSVPVIYAADFDTNISADRASLYSAFLAAGLDPNTVINPPVGQNWQGMSVLQMQFNSCSPKNDRINIVKMLLNKGAAWNYTTPDGISVLHIAASWGYGGVCSTNLVKQLGVSLRRADLIAKGIYFEKKNASPIDYSTSGPDFTSGACRYGGPAIVPNQYSLATYLATLDPDFQTEFHQKSSQQSGTPFGCVWVTEFQ